MNPSPAEKRDSRRREILEHFSFYIGIPKLGDTRHRVKDVSESGIGLELDTLGEFKLARGESCELHFYLNQSLFLPLQIEVMRESEKDSVQTIGAAFVNREASAYATYQTLMKLVDQLSEFGEIKKI